MRVRNHPWGRCSKAIRNECKNPCSHYLAHHIPPWGHCWCHCEPVERPKEYAHWAKWNRALVFRLSVENALMRMKRKYDRANHKWIDMGEAPYPNPHSHLNEEGYEET